MKICINGEKGKRNFLTIWGLSASQLFFKRYHIINQIIFILSDSNTYSTFDLN